MKKYLLLLLILSSSGFVKAQSTQSGWYDFVNSFSIAQANGGFDLNKNLFSAITWPDTFVKIIYINANTSGADPQYSNWCSWGTSFDPTDSIFSLDGDALDAVPGTSNFSVDSVEYFYSYQRHTNSSVIDTLVFQATKVAATNSFVFTDQTTHQVIQRIGTVGYDNKTALAKNMDITVKIPLGAADTSTFAFKTFSQKLNISCSPGDFVVSTVTFKPGNAYKKNDTIADFYAADTNAGRPTKKFNTFRLLIDEDLNATENRPLRPNNGLVVNSQQRYINDWFQSPSLSPMYIAATGFGARGATALYPRTQYKVTSDFRTAIDNRKSTDFSVGNVYPNPANGNAVIPFSLTKSENINVEISDMLGRKIMTVASGDYSSGKHNVSFNTESMKPGLYFYTFTANGFTQTGKFTVVQ